MDLPLFPTLFFTKHVHLLTPLECRKWENMKSCKTNTIGKIFPCLTPYLLFNTVKHTLHLSAALFESLLYTIYRFRLLSQQFVVWTCQTFYWIKGAELLVLTKWFNVIGSGTSKRKVDASFLGGWRLLPLLFLVFIWAFSETVLSPHWPVKYQT